MPIPRNRRHLDSDTGDTGSGEGTPSNIGDAGGSDGGEKPPRGMVTFGKIPGDLHEQAIVPGETTIRQLFEGTNLRIDGSEIQRNGAPANLDDMVEAGDTVLVMAKIKGNG
jgi:hypothetical protein